MLHSLPVFIICVSIAVRKVSQFESITNKLQQQHVNFHSGFKHTEYLKENLQVDWENAIEYLSVFFFCGSSNVESDHSPHLLTHNEKKN
jgi:hypothetical protein